MLEDPQKIFNICKAALLNGCWGFDTAPSYRNEELIGNAIRMLIDQRICQRESIFLSTKIDGLQMAETNGHIRKYVEESLKKFKLDYIDLLLIHWPFDRYLYSTWLEMQKLVVSGKIRYIGICNVDKKKYINMLESSLITKPDFIQNEISPLRTCSEDINYFKGEDINIMAYSPLARMEKRIKDAQSLNLIASRYQVTIPQIILKWHIERKIIPVFTSSKVERVFSNLDLKNFSLTEDELRAIELLNCNYKRFPESFGCPGY